MEILFGIAGIAFYAWEYYAMNKYWYSKRSYIVFDSGKFFARKFFISIFIGWIFIIIQILDILYQLVSKIIKKQPISIHKQKQQKIKINPGTFRDQHIHKSKDMISGKLTNSENTPRKILHTIFLIIRWVLFMCLSFLTLVCFLTSIISGIAMIVSAALMCPSVNKLLMPKLPIWLQIVLSTIFFCVAAMILP